MGEFGQDGTGNPRLEECHWAGGNQLYYGLGMQNGKLAMPLAHYPFSKMTYEPPPSAFLPNADPTGFWHSAMPPTCTSIELVTVYREPNCFTNT